MWVVVVVPVAVPAVLAVASAASFARRLAAQGRATAQGHAATLVPALRKPFLSVSIQTSRLWMPGKRAAGQL